MTVLPTILEAEPAKATLEGLFAKSVSVFQALFVEERAIPEGDVPVDISALLRANLCFQEAPGVVRANFRVSKVFELFIATDFPSYEGSDRVWYLLEDESLLFARRIPDCAGKHVLDIGSGSGVLALMAARNGALSATSIDVSPRSTHLGRFNAALNGIQTATFLNVGLEKFETGRKFDYITFNPPFVPIPDDTTYMLSGSGGRDGLALVHAFFAKLEDLAHSATMIGIISMSPGDEQISALERLFVSRYYGTPTAIVATDVYGSVATVDIAFAPFANEHGFGAWREWLAAMGYSHMHYLFITVTPADRYSYRREMLCPPLEDLADSGTWGAMYRVIANSKSHA